MFDNKKFVDEVMIPIMGLIALLIVLFVAPGHAHAQSGNVYGAYQAQVQGQAQEGVVLQVALKRTAASAQSVAASTGLGAVVGGLLGNAIPDNNARGAAAAIGAMVGGFIGNQTSESVGGNDAQEILVALKDPRTNTVGQVISVVQPAPFTAVSAGDQVWVVSTGGATRIIKNTSSLSASR